jgi:hypothetical protein
MEVDCFPSATGGRRGFGSTLEEAIENCLKENKLEGLS